MKEVEFGGVKVKFISRKEFANYLGISIQGYWLWLGKGILLPPAYKDENNLANNFGKEKAPRKFYVYQEAVVVRKLMQEYTFGRGRIVPVEFIERAHTAMREVREMVNVADSALMDYPVILEFMNFDSLLEYLKEFIPGVASRELQKYARSMFLKGNKLL